MSAEGFQRPQIGEMFNTSGGKLYVKGYLPYGTVILGSFTPDKENNFRDILKSSLSVLNAEKIEQVTSQTIQGKVDIDTVNAFNSGVETELGKHIKMMADEASVKEFTSQMGLGMTNLTVRLANILAMGSTQNSFIETNKPFILVPSRYKMGDDLPFPAVLKCPAIGFSRILGKRALPVLTTMMSQRKR